MRSDYLEGAMPLPAGETKVIVFSDFDGTITLNDSNGMEHLGWGADRDRLLD